MPTPPMMASTLLAALLAAAPAAPVAAPPVGAPQPAAAPPAVPPQMPASARADARAAARAFRPAPARVREAPLRAHLAFLADDLLEGRGTGQRGGDLAMRYLEAQLQALGLEPAVAGAWRQRAEVLGTRLRTADSAVTFHAPDAAAGPGLHPAIGEEIVLAAGLPRAEVALEAPLVFVGFGITSPEWRWDDLKGADLKGKLLLMLVNEPPPTAEEPGLFDGDDLTEYGRWTWKFEQAARLGAAGVLLVHTDASAAYPWSVVQTGFGGEKFQLAAEPGGAPLQGWVTEGLARRLVAAGGQELDALRAQALRRDFRPVALGLTATARLASDVRRFSQENVAGLVRGTDPALAREAVVYSAHWDHFGKVGDRTFNGAVDNASGCAAVLALAEATAASPARRSQLFLFTFGEEQGLLGAAAWVAHPPWPLADTVADLNLESLNWVGPSRDVEFLGGDRSTLQEAVQPVASRLGLALRAREPDRSGLYFRSDHWPFARAGVPSASPGFSLAGQRDYLGDGAARRAQAAGYLGRYHQESDDYDPAWDLSGMLQQAELVLELGRAVADAPGRPAWKPGRAPRGRTP